ncbi:CMRF35-like molecule 9 [Engraulis encrasicolus]|uniref:CMRF35-like molecule 9 n=1 Tax=Engraulis encrasicolus TaxID=184585 RepID=UPI002FCFCCFD
MRSILIMLLVINGMSCVCSVNVSVSGDEGGAVAIHCPYEKDYANNRKYLQKAQSSISSSSSHTSSSVSKLIQSEGEDERINSGRVSLQDQKRNNTFTVTIHNLTVEDAGIYACGVQRGFEDYITSKVNVTVVPSPSHVATSDTPSALTTVAYSANVNNTQTADISGEGEGVSLWLVAALVGLGLLLVTSTTATMVGRAKCKRASSSSLSGNTKQDGNLYSEIQYTSPPATHTPNQIHRMPGSANQHPSATSNFYSLSTIPVATFHSGGCSIANQGSEFKSTTNQNEPQSSSELNALVTPPQSSLSNENIYSLLSNPMEANLSSVSNKNYESSDTPNESSVLSDIYTLATPITLKGGHPIGLQSANHIPQSSSASIL